MGQGSLICGGRPFCGINTPFVTGFQATIMGSLSREEINTAYSPVISPPPHTTDITSRAEIIRKLSFEYLSLCCSIVQVMAVFNTWLAKFEN